MTGKMKDFDKVVIQIFQWTESVEQWISLEISHDSWVFCTHGHTELIYCFIWSVFFTIWYQWLDWK